MAKIKQCWILLVSIILLSNGCATAGGFPLLSSHMGARGRIHKGREVTFPLKNSQDITPDHEQPETIVQFAIDLAEKGEAEKAASFFLEVADSKRADSRWNRFRIECVAAAASLYFQIGNLKRFHETVTRLRGELDRFQLASAEPEIAILLAIDDELRGRAARLPREIPWFVRDLFRHRR